MVARRTAVIVLTVLLISLLATGCGPKTSANKEGNDNAPVKVVKAKKDVLVETSVVSGKLEAIASSDVVPSGAGGKVESVRVSVGDRVEKGQTLVTLENDLLSIGVEQAEQGVEQAKIGIELAKVNYQKAQTDYQRGKTLLEQGAIPRAVDNPMAGKGYEDYEVAYKSAEQGLENARSALEIARTALAQARESYSNAFIKAPISGVVTAVNVDPGEMASPAAGPVVSIADLTKVVVKATVDEELVNKLKKGDKVEVTVSAVSAQPFKGKITTVAPAADRATKAFPVEVEVNNPEGLLKPGMLAEITFTRRYPDSIVVPKEAVGGAGGQRVVWVVKDGTAQKREVKIGADTGKMVIIISGLQEGEQVVVKGNDSLRDGDKVKV